MDHIKNLSLFFRRVFVVIISVFSTTAHGSDYQMAGGCLAESRTIYYNDWSSGSPVYRSVTYPVGYRDPSPSYSSGISFPGDSPARTAIDSRYSSCTSSAYDTFARTVCNARWGFSVPFTCGHMMTGGAGSGNACTGPSGSQAETCFNNFTHMSASAGGGECWRNNCAQTDATPTPTPTPEPVVVTDGNVRLSPFHQQIDGHATSLGILASSGATGLDVKFNVSIMSARRSFVVPASSIVSTTGGITRFRALIGAPFSVPGGGNNPAVDPLKCGDTVTYQAVASYAGGTYAGAVNTFSTVPCPSTCKPSWGTQPLKQAIWEYVSGGSVYTQPYNVPRPSSTAYLVCEYEGYVTDNACSMLTGILSGHPAGQCQQPALHPGPVVSGAPEVYRIARQKEQNLGDQVFVGGGASFGCSLEGSSGMDPGQVRCWGRNIEGQLGTGAAGNFAVHAQPVVDWMGAGGGYFLQASKLTVGYNSACAISTIGNVECWGSNGSGQLGQSTSALPYSATPVKVNLSSLLSSGETPVDISMSGYYPNTASGSSALVTGCSESSVSIAGSSIPTNHCARVNVCVATNLGKMYCWGNNGEGQFGIGTPASATVVLSPTQAFKTSAGAFYTDVKRVEAGTTAICALRSSGEIHCAGSANNTTLKDRSSIGLLGLSSAGASTASISSYNPVAVQDAQTGTNLKAKEFSFNGFSGCAIVTQTSGSSSGSDLVQCWGYSPTINVGSGSSTYTLTGTLRPRAAVVTATSKGSTWVSTHLWGESYGGVPASVSSFDTAFIGLNYGSYARKASSSSLFPNVTLSGSSFGSLKVIGTGGPGSYKPDQFTKPSLIGKGTHDSFDLYAIMGGLVKSTGQEWYGALGNNTLPGSTITTTAAAFTVQK